MFLSTFACSAPAFYRSGTALEIESGPGVGKSSVMHEIARELSKAHGSFGLVTNILSQMDPVDIKGFCIPIKDPSNPSKVEARFTSPSVFPAMWNTEVYVNGKPAEGPVDLPEHGILFLDEFGQSSMETQKVAAQLLLDRRIGEYRLPKGWVVWCASNRLKDKSGVNKRLSFVQNRLKTLSIQPAYDPWADWATRQGVHPLAITYAKRYPGSVFKDEVPAVPGPYCTPRSLVLCTQDLMAMKTEAHGDMRLPDDEVAMEVMSGWLGEGTAVEFVSHVRLANELPEIEQVAKRPKDTRIPERPDAQFIMASMLGHHAKEANLSAFCDYVWRMPMEMQVLFVYSVVRRAPQLMGADKISIWVTANKDLLQAANAS